MNCERPSLCPAEILETLIQEWTAAGDDLRHLSLEEVKRRFVAALQEEHRRLVTTALV